jgi:hypothetical protein
MVATFRRYGSDCGRATDWNDKQRRCSQRGKGQARTNVRPSRRNASLGLFHSIRHLLPDKPLHRRAMRGGRRLGRANQLGAGSKKCGARSAQGPRATKTIYPACIGFLASSERSISTARLLFYAIASWRSVAPAKWGSGDGVESTRRSACGGWRRGF